MSYAPIANFFIYGIHLAVYLGAATFISLIATVTLGMLVLREGSNVPFSWHLNMARVTVAVALIHVTVVYLTFF